MVKKSLCIALLALTTLSSSAQKKEWFNNVKLSGYGMTQYQYSDQKGNKSNSFNLRLFRLVLDGRILNDFYWKAQIQVNGNTSTLGSSPRLVDLFAEWQKYDYFKVKIGEFKRPFTFDNPLHPIDQGFMGVGQIISKLSGFSDRTGEHPSNGRDLGLQVQGDFLKNAAGRNLLHYQIGVFNGQGINTKDVDQRKDIIGGLWVMPVEGLRLGVFGWEGSSARKGNWTYAGGTHTALGNKADGFYGLVIAPVIQKKVHIKARYDLYRPTAEWNRSRTQYEVGADYYFHKNFQINVEYARINDRTLAKHNYNMIDVEVDFRF